jgi:hypothetical protein
MVIKEGRLFRVGVVRERPVESSSALVHTISGGREITCSLPAAMLAVGLG